MAKVEIHIVKDKNCTTMQISGTISDVIMLLGETAYTAAQKYEIDVKNMCIAITECAEAEKMKKYLVEKLESGLISKAGAMVTAEAYFNCRRKHLEEQANDE